MPTIRVSDAVFSELKRCAEPLVDTPDSVLRKVLGLTSDEDTGKTGRLQQLLQRGRLRAGEQLTWRRTRAGQSHTATVLPNGCIRLSDGRIADSPSGACSMLTNNKSFDGWKEWRTSDGTLLTDLR